MRLLVCLLLAVALGALVGCCSCSSEREERPLITGRIDKSILANPANPWFAEGYNGYTVKEEVVQFIGQNKDSVHIKVFMGSWCSDCRREMPHFYKIVEMANFTDFEVFQLDRKKQSADGTELQYDIRRVPTFVFLKAGNEIGRIVETPEKTLEEDIAGFLAKAKSL